MVKSVVIITDSSPLGKNSSTEAIRLGSGFMGLGTDIACKIVFRGDAVLTLRKSIDPAKIGMNSLSEHLEMAELSDLELCVVEEDLKSRGLTSENLVDYELLKVVNLAVVSDMIQNAETTFRF
jgi:sulfur relay (sulfurtransferase) DsrF/TusC family protein